jgi:hypothetical protein
MGWNVRVVSGIDMTVCLPEKDYVTRGWHKLSRGDNPSYHTLTRFII